MNMVSGSKLVVKISNQISYYIHALSNLISIHFMLNKSSIPFSHRVDRQVITICRFTSTLLMLKPVQLQKRQTTSPLHQARSITRICIKCDNCCNHICR